MDPNICEYKSCNNDDQSIMILLLGKGKICIYVFMSLDIGE